MSIQWRIEVRRSTSGPESTPYLVVDSTQSANTHITGGFRWQLAGRGHKQLIFTGNNSQLKIRGGDLLTLKHSQGGSIYFYGEVIDPPSMLDNSWQEITVVGAARFLEASVVDSGTWYTKTGVFAIARNLIFKFKHPALKYAASAVGNGSGGDAGPILDLFYMPTATLGAALEALRGMLGGRFEVWVDEFGIVHFDEPAQNGWQVPMAQVEGYLRQETAEVCSKSILRIVSAPSTGLAESGAFGNYGSGLRAYAYIPATVSRVVYHRNHEVTHAVEKVFTPEAGVALIRTNAPDSSGAASMANELLARDADVTTYAVSNANGPRLEIRQTDTTVRTIGVQVRYSWQPAGNENAELRVVHHKGDYANRHDYGVWQLRPSPAVREERFIFPPSVALVGGLEDAWQSWAAIEAGSGAAGELRIYDFRFLVVDDVVARAEAAKHLQMPYESPLIVKWPNYIGPTPTITLTDAPGGPATARVAIWEYEISPEAGEITRARFGSTGQGEAARVIRLKTQEQAKTAANAVRSYLEGKV